MLSLLPARASDTIAIASEAVAIVGESQQHQRGEQKPVKPSLLPVQASDTSEGEQEASDAVAIAGEGQRHQRGRARGERCRRYCRRGQATPATPSLLPAKASDTSEAEQERGRARGQARASEAVAIASDTIAITGEGQRHQRGRAKASDTSDAEREASDAVAIAGEGQPDHRYSQRDQRYCRRRPASPAKLSERPSLLLAKASDTSEAEREVSDTSEGERGGERGAERGRAKAATPATLK
ncbi:hypothetical protein MMC16_007678 [Acarospora aff. strigata]|nr:hypothetical protein [Acarospora aff. strigata]